MRFTDKVVDVPVGVAKLIFMVQQKTVEVPQVQYTDKLVVAPVVLQPEFPPSKLCNNRWNCH